MRKASRGLQEVRHLVPALHPGLQFEEVRLQSFLARQDRDLRRLSDPKSRHGALHHQSQPRTGGLRPDRRFEPLRIVGFRPL